MLELQNLLDHLRESVYLYVKINLEGHIITVTSDPNMISKRSSLHISNDLMNFMIILGSKATRNEIIFSLMHELGHFLEDIKLSYDELRMRLVRGKYEKCIPFISSTTMEGEVNAWSAGYEYFKNNNLEIPFGLTDQIAKSLLSYLVNLFPNEKRRWIEIIGKFLAIISTQQEAFDSHQLIGQAGEQNGGGKE